MAFGDATQHSYANRPRVRFSAIGEGWDLFKDQWLTWVVTSLVVIVVNSLLGGIAVALLPDDLKFKFDPNGLQIKSSQGPTFLVAAIESLINGFLYAGMFRMACLQIRGRRIHVSDLFSVTDVAGQLAIGVLLSFLLVSVGFGCCFLPGLVISSVLMFVAPLIVDGRLPGVEAIGRSWGALKGEMLTATLFYFVVVVLHSLGAIFCGIGLLFTMPIYCLSIAVLYRDFFLGKSYLDADKPTVADPDF
jgi:hypothetical protein